MATKTNVLSIPLTLVLSTVLLFAQALRAQDTINLEEAIAIAMQHSPSILTSELNMTISEENLKAREAGVKSNFAMTLTPFAYNQTRAFNDLYNEWYTTNSTRSSGTFTVSQPIVATDATISLNNQFEYRESYSEFNNESSSGFSNNLYLLFSQPIFTYNRIKMELEELKLAHENAVLSYSLQRMYLEQQVTQAFYQVYQQQMQLKVAEDEFANQQQSFEIIKSKVEGGLLPREELYQAELNLASAESSLKNSITGLENTKDQFKNYIGMELSRSFVPQADVDYQVVDVSLQRALQNALEMRMELRQREISLENSYNNLEVAKATNEFWGQVDLSLGLIGNNRQFMEIYDQPTRSPAVGVTFSIPIWDWGVRKSRIKAAEASIKIQEIEMSSQKNDIELSIRQSYRALENLTMQIEIARKRAENAQLTYEINLERYRNGDLTSMDLNLFQNQLSEAKMNQVNSLINYKLELLNMKIISLWDFENNSSFAPKYK